jgi:hypothetical protein
MIRLILGVALYAVPAEIFEAAAMAPAGPVPSPHRGTLPIR